MNRTMIAVLWAALTATAAAAQADASGPNPRVRAVAVGDIDGDADLDLVFAVEDDRLRVWIGDGRGGFAVAADGAVPADALPARGLALFDADGDGDLDVALACYLAPNVVLVNDGGGRFSVGPSLGDRASAWTSSVAAGDVDGDGDADLVFGNLDGPNDLWVQEPGLRFVHAPQRFPDTAGRSACVAMGDFDRDGDLDIVFGNTPNMSRQGGADQVFLNGGAGRFEDRSDDHQLGRFHTLGVALGDADGDGDLDLVAAHSAARGEPGVRNTVHIFNQRFLAGSIQRMPSDVGRTEAVALGDLDGDGDLDAVFANEGQNQLVLGDAAGKFVEAPAGSMPSDGAHSVGVALGDFDGDGDLDIAFANQTEPSVVLLNDGRGRFAAVEARSAAPAAARDAAPESADGGAVDDDSGAGARAGSGVSDAVDHLWTELGDPDLWVAERAAYALATRGGDVARELLDVIEPGPETAEQRQRARFAALALRRLGSRARTLADDFIELLDEASVAATSDAKKQHFAALLDAFSELAPYAQQDGFAVKEALLEWKSQHGGTAAFARAWSRLTVPVDASVDDLHARQSDPNPFVRELVAELLESRGATWAPGVGGAHPADVAIEVAGAAATKLTLPSTAFVDDRIALASLAANAGDLDALAHWLNRAGARWQGPEGAMLRRRATDAAVALVRLRAQWVVAAPDGALSDRGRKLQTALERILRPAFPIVLTNSDELELVKAALDAIACLGPLGVSSTDVVTPLTARPEVASRARDALRAFGAKVVVAPAERPDIRRVAGGLYSKRPSGRQFMRSRSAANAIGAGLNWLAAHQDADGRWNADDFMQHDVGEPKSDGRGKPEYDIGVTGLALACFLAEANTTQDGEFAGVVRNGVTWLAGQVGADGRIGSGALANQIYCQAIGTLALAEAWGMSGAAELEDVVRRAVGYIVAHRGTMDGWRYQRGERADTSVTAWCVCALRAAADFGLEVPDGVFTSGLRWFDAMVDLNAGRVGYMEPGGRSARMSGVHPVEFPPEHTEAMTAAAMFAKIRCGDRASAVTLKQEQLLEQRLPSTEPGERDFYYWFWASHAMHQLGGAPARTWQGRAIEVLLPLQEKRGAAAGSWHPDGVWGADGGRVYTTAMAILALQAEYRFAKAVDPRWRVLVRGR